MDITRDNFKDSLPIITEAVNAASFISIDGEFTGLTNGSYNLTVYDSPDERYRKLHSNTDNFLLLQFGMSVFRWDDEAQKYDVKAFNFYIFPFRSSFSGCPDRVFSCQSSSVDFLIQQGFDFNLAFRKGIPYLRQNEEANIRTTLDEKQAFRDAEFKSPTRGSHHSQRKRSYQSPATDGGSKPTPITDQKTMDFMENVVKVVERFLEDEEKSELTLDPCNSYLRKILYETLPSKFPDQILVESRMDEQTKQRHVVVVRGADDATRRLRQERLRQREEDDLEAAVGFSRIVKLLSESQKLIIGHNMLLDVIFTIRQFVAALPPTLDQFKSMVQCIFPRIIDTKLMANMLPFKDHIQSSALGEMHARLLEAPFNPPDVEAPGKYQGEGPCDDNLHEAAYDAFITGAAFLSMGNYLFSYQHSNMSRPSFSSLSSVITPYENKVFLMRTHDLPYLNLCGSDLTPNRDHVFHVEFPSCWRATDLRQLFSPLGQINIAWISDTKCFVGLYDKSQAKHVKKMLVQSNVAEPSSYQISSYEEYKSSSLLPARSLRTWHRSNPPASSSMSFTSSLQATSINPTEAGSSEIPPATRKRGTRQNDEEIVTSRRDEPQVKRQKSQEERPLEDGPNEAIIHPEQENGSSQTSLSPVAKETVSTKTSNNVTALFEVPDEW